MSWMTQETSTGTSAPAYGEETRSRIHNLPAPKRIIQAYLNQLNERSAVRFKDSQFQLVDVIDQILVPLEN